MEFLLDPDVTFLNHGSYGACPAPVFERYQELQRELERNPVEFLGRRFDELTAEARAALAGFVGARRGRSRLRPERDLRAERGHPLAAAGAGRRGADDPARVRRRRRARGSSSALTLVYAEPDELAGAIGPRTKAVSVSHITSPTALVLPVEEICAAAREAGVLSIVDGAHAPGQLPLDLERLGADIYAGNCHKWLCAPKGAGFLWARPEHQDWIEPLVVSWGYGAEMSFADRHGWQGTRDPAAALAVPAAIDAHRAFDLERCRRLAASFHDRLPPVGPTPAPQMWASEVDDRRSGRPPAAPLRGARDRGRRAGVGGEEPAPGLDRALQRGRRRRAAARRAGRIRRAAGLTGGLTAGAGYGTLAPM